LEIIAGLSRVLKKYSKNKLAMKGYTINLEWLINKLMKKNSPFNNSNWLLMINQMTIKVSKS